MHLANRLGDQVRRGLLQHNAGTAELHGLHKFVLVFRGRQHNHPRLAIGVLQRLQGRQAIHVGHAQVQQQHIGLQRLHAFQYLAAIAGLTHHLNVLVERQQAAQTIAHNRMVIGDQHANRALRRRRIAFVIVGPAKRGGRGWFAQLASFGELGIQLFRIERQGALRRTGHCSGLHHHLVSSGWPMLVPILVTVLTDSDQAALARSNCCDPSLSEFQYVAYSE